MNQQLHQFDYRSRRNHSQDQFGLFKRRFRIALGVTAIFAVLVIGLIFFLKRDLPSLEQLENIEPHLISRVYSSDGKLIKEFYTQRRVYTPLEEIPMYLKQGLLASEDQRFYEHWGFNVVRTFKALAIDIMSLSWEQGASTITQQLARNLYNTIGTKKTIIRKIREAITAVQIERTYTKPEILEMYLNSVYFGHGVYGLEAASRAYFDKRARHLNLNECATLVGLLPLPEHYSPLNHPDTAIRRRNIVLSLMVEQKFITPQDYRDHAVRELYTNSTIRDEEGLSPYFTEHVRQQLEQESRRLGINPYTDGLNIYTTLDYRLQTIANRLYAGFTETQQGRLNIRLLNNSSQLREIARDSEFSIDEIKQMLRSEIPVDSSLQSKLIIQAAFVALDPSNGHILAMIGGRDFSKSKFNRATQAQRQPGSVFKPFIYTALVDKGIPITTQLPDIPITLYNDDGSTWRPENFDGSTNGLTTLRDGLRGSINNLAVRAVQELTKPSVVADYAHRMGIHTSLREVPAIALGTSEVIPLEVTAAYSVFANHGLWTQPVAITRIDDKNGNTIVDYRPHQEEVLSEETAYIMADMMKTVMNYGTGKPARDFYDFHRPAGGKTGTTQNYTDAWFVGYTPQLAAGVWFGLDDPSVSLGYKQYGSVVALPLWAEFMKTAHEELSLPVRDFDRPPGVVTVEICQVSKNRASEYCPVSTEIFNKRYLPAEQCEIHGRYKQASNSE